MPDRPPWKTFPRYQTPEEDGSVFVEPDWREIGAVLAGNQECLSQAHSYDCQGKRLGDLSREARQELLDQARQWTASYHPLGEQAPFWVENGSPPSVPRQPTEENNQNLVPHVPKIFLSGHQPQLFHPGVWLKNFALERLARLHQAVAINLIVDHDVPHTTSIRTPTGSVHTPKWTEIPLDDPAPGVPYEDRPIINRSLVETFGQRATEALKPLTPEPMLKEFWPMVLQQAEATHRLGAALAQARHRWEIRWKSSSLEVPFSRLCRGKAFLWFVGHLIAHLPRFQEAYNTILAEYRQAHRIRNSAQPLPDLRTDGDWFEAPFWIWTAQEPIRRPLYVQPHSQEAILSDRTGLEIRLPIKPDGDLSRTSTILKEWTEQGVRIRPRALITTLWARLALGDLFLHGIGGARYDQITDELIRRFMGLEPPRYLVLSGTLYLPIHQPRVKREKWLDLQKQLRDLTWHPERFFEQQEKVPLPPGNHFPTSDGPEDLILEKWRWIRMPVTPENVRTRFLTIRRINHALQPWLSEIREKLLAEKTALELQLQAEKILFWRDLPFCYYPEQTLRDFFFGVLREIG